MLRPIFHSSVMLLNIFSLWYDQKYVDIPLESNVRTVNLPFKSRVLYLTHWCFVLQTVYFAVALLNDVFGTNQPLPKKRSLIRGLKDVIFVLAFPIAAYVTVSFWGIYAIDRELIFPKSLDAFFPNWLNHVLHSSVLVFIFIELVTSFRAFPPKNCGVSLVLIFMTAYIFWINYLYFNYDFWVYPILGVLNWSARIPFLSLSAVIGLVFYFIGEKLNSIIWSKQLTVSKSTGKTKKKKN